MQDEKSYARIARNDLKHLLSIARQEREDFFSRHKEYAILYRKRVHSSRKVGKSSWRPTCRNQYFELE